MFMIIFGRGEKIRQVNEVNPVITGLIPLRNQV